MPDFREEAKALNDLMEEAFDLRPIRIGMMNDEAMAWITKLQIHWINRCRDAALKAEKKNR